MIIYKETEIKHPLYITTLDNGVTIFVYDGYAEGSDGRVYKPVVKDIRDGECEVVGWKKCVWSHVVFLKLSTNCIHKREII